MSQGHNNFVGNSITVGSNWFHKVDKVKPRWVGSSAVTAFRIKIKIKNHPKHYLLTFYCSYFKPLDEVGLKDGDSVKINSIQAISANQYEDSEQPTFFMTIGDLEVKKAEQQDFPEVPVEETIPDIPSDEDSPFDI